MENQLFTLLRIAAPLIGNFVKDKLEAENIEVFFTNEGLKMGSEYDPNEVLLKVKGKDSEKAVKTLLRLHKEYNLEALSREKDLIPVRRLLVPVKFSEECQEMCRFALEIANRMDAEIKVLYVYPDPTLGEPERHTTSWGRYVKIELKEAYKEAEKKLLEFSRVLKEKVPDSLLQSVKVHYRMLKGTPENVITDACKRYRPHLVLMGSKVSKKESGEFLGKTIEKVLMQTGYPVLAVPPKAKFPDKEKLNVMYGTNFYDSDNKSLDKLLEITAPFDKKIDCVHIDLHDDRHHKEKVYELNKMLAGEYKEHHIECQLIESENIIEGFDSFVEKNDIDVIAMSQIRHSAFYKMFHKDLLVELVSTEKVPILMFPV